MTPVNLSFHLGRPESGPRVLHGIRRPMLGILLAPADRLRRALELDLFKLLRKDCKTVPRAAGVATALSSRGPLAGVDPGAANDPELEGGTVTVVDAWPGFKLGRPETSTATSRLPVPATSGCGAGRSSSSSPVA